MGASDITRLNQMALAMDSIALIPLPQFPQSMSKGFYGIYTRINKTELYNRMMSADESEVVRQAAAVIIVGASSWGHHHGQTCSSSSGDIERWHGALRWQRHKLVAAISCKST